MSSSLCELGCLHLWQTCGTFQVIQICLCWHVCVDFVYNLDECQKVKQIHTVSGTLWCLFILFFTSCLLHFRFSSLTYNSYLKLLLEAYSRHHISTPVNAWICIWCDSLVIPLHVSNSLYFIQGKRTLPYCTCHTWYFTLQVLETLGLHFYLHTCGVNVIDGMNTACD